MLIIEAHLQKCLKQKKEDKYQYIFQSQELLKEITGIISKNEKFIVVRGKAAIRFRKIDSDKVIE